MKLNIEAEAKYNVSPNFYIKKNVTGYNAKTRLPTRKMENKRKTKKRDV